MPNQKYKLILAAFAALFSIIFTLPVSAKMNSPYCGPAALSAVYDRLHVDYSLEGLNTKAAAHHGLTNFKNLIEQLLEKLRLSLMLKSGVKTEETEAVDIEVKDIIISKDIAKPKFILIFPCCVFEAILSKVNMSEVDFLKKQNILTNCKIFGAYVYGEIGVYEKELMSGSGTVTSLIIGDELAD